MPKKDSVGQVITEVLQEIIPSDQEKKEISNKIQEVMDNIKKNLKDAKVVLGGSGAKDTWLHGSYDADIFVQFNYKKYHDKSDQLSTVLEKALKKFFSLNRFHGSRDYFQIKKNGFTFEIVPILAITNASQAKNITDVSPLHAQYVNKFKKLKNEMRLLKKFLKTQHIYGAESHIKGFSGYVTEILIIHYKGFLNTIKAIASWSDKVILDPAKHYKNKDDIVRNLNLSKQISPIIIIDPVDKSRNAAAAIEEKQFNKLKRAAKEFLSHPHRSFFEEKGVTVEDIVKQHKGKSLVMLKVEGLPGKPDITGTKILKVFEFLEKQLEPFKVAQKDWHFDNKKDALLWFVVKEKVLPPKEIVQGPPVKLKEFVKDFKKKYTSTFNKKGRIFAYKRREFQHVEELLKQAIKNNYVKERAASISLLKN